MAVTANDVQALYIAYFNRPADFLGLTFQVDQANKFGLQFVADQFSKSPEYTATYAGKGTAEIIDTIYMNLFGRHAEPAGISFWGKLYDNKTLTLGNIALTIFNGALNDDKIAVTNKLTAATAFYNSLDTSAEIVGYSGDAANQVVKAWMGTITTDASLAAATTDAALLAVSTAAVAAHDAVANPPKTFTLTASVDTLTGTSGNDIFQATGSTLTALDSIDGGAGSNALTVTDAAGVMNTAIPAGVALKNIQTMNITTIKSLGAVGSAGSAGTTAVKQIDKVTIAGTAGGGETFTVVWNGISATTASVTTDAAAETAVANAINAIAGSTVATVVGADIIITAAVAGTALPAFSVTGSTLGAVAPSVQQANVPGVAATPAVTAAVYDLSGFALKTINTTTTGGENVAASATTDVNATDTGATSTTQISGGNNVTITESGTAGAVVADGAAGTTTITQNTAGNVTVGATTAPTGAIVVNDTAQGAGAIALDGGTTVTLTTTSTSSTGATTIGSVTKPSGAISVTENLNVSATNSASIGTITVTGGTTVSVTEKATEGLRTTTGANGTATQGNVVVNGGSATTAVTVAQTKAVSAVNTTVAIAGATEAVSEQFTALGAGQSLAVGGLIFTAGAAGTTKAQTAAAFANLSAGMIQGNSTLGTYSGVAFAGWTTGAVSGTNSDTVTFTSTTANAVIAAPTFTLAGAAGAGTVPTATVTTTGAAATSAVTGKAGIATGTVTIVDSKYAGNTGAGVITSATLDGYNTTAVSSDTLTSLSLANSAAAVTVNNRAATTLGLTVNGLGTGSTLTLDAAAVKYTTLNITTATADSKLGLTAAGVQTLKVAGTNAVDLSTSAAFTALKTVTVTGSAGVTMAAGGANVTDVNASATSGAVTISALNPTNATYEGGSGVDTVTLTTTTVSKAISLGAGNDTITLASGTTSLGATIDGGTGTGDTLVMVAADAQTASASGAFATKAIGFEILQLTGGTGAQSIAVNTLGGYNQVVTGGEAAGGVLTMDGFTSGGTLTLNSATGGGSYALTSSAFTTPTTDVFNIIVTNAASTAAGSVSANSIETINLTSTDTTSTHAAGTNTNSLTLAADSVTAVKVMGNANLTLSVAGDTTITSIDASGMTAGLSVTTAGGVAETVKGGALSNALISATGTKADVLIGGAAADTLTANQGADTLTGGAGADTFVIGAGGLVTANVNTYTTITDAAVGDSIKLIVMGTDTFATSKITLANTAVFQDYANAVIAATSASGTNGGNGYIGWFQFNGDTYVVENLHNAAGASFVNGTDLVVKLTGVVDLSHTSINPTAGTLLIG